MNVFRKCLRRHMGRRTYQSFYDKCQEKFQKNSIAQLKTKDSHLYDALYESVIKDDLQGLEEKIQDVVDTLKIASRITRYFGMVVLAYLIGNIVLLTLNLDYYVTCISILLMGICFIYKIVEYVSNKYCVLDVYLFMVYRTVLEKRTQDMLS